MIRIYTGRLGAGKSYGMMDDVATQVKTRRVQVYTCMRTARVPGAVYFDVERINEICDYSSGLIVLDEGHIAFSARSFQSTSKAALIALSQLRKNGLDLYVTTQHREKLDKQLRDLVTEEYCCKMLGKWFIRRVVDPNLRDALERRKPLRWSVRKLNPSVFGLYNSWEVLGSQQPTGVDRAVWLDNLREWPKDARADRKGKDSDPFAVPVLRLWDSGARRGLTAEASQARAFLIEQGVLDPVEWSLESDRRTRRDGPLGGWLDLVAAEVRRRRWLAVFGLSGRQVPLYVTPEHPWALGYCPQMEDHRQGRKIRGEDVPACPICTTWSLVKSEAWAPRKESHETKRDRLIAAAQRRLDAWS